jgi:hypothetical protein
LLELNNAGILLLAAARDDPHRTSVQLPTGISAS